MLKTLAGNKKYLLILVIFLQIGILTAMVVNSYQIIARGDKVTLKVEPLDPRSLFQGDYVILRYPFNNLNLNKVEHDLDLDKINYQQDIYLALEPKGEAWEPVLATQNPARVKDKTYLTGKVLYLRPEPQPILHLKFNIENFFVPEGKGKEIEKQIQEGVLYAQVSVYKGKARVMGLVSK